MAQISAYSEVTTTFKDTKLLVAALHEMGFTEVEVHAEAQPLIDFTGKVRPQLANVIIRRKHVGYKSNDIGLVKGEDGTYSAIISEYDSAKYGKSWLAKLKASYTDKAIMQVAKSKGLRFLSRKLDDKTGKVNYQFLQQ